MKTEEVGGIETTSDYWDCECEKNYRNEIHGLRGEVQGGRKELLESFDRLENIVMRAIKVLEEKMDQILEL